MPTTFLSLPAEIKVHIYKLSLQSARFDLKIYTDDGFHNKLKKVEGGSGIEVTSTATAGLLLVSRLVTTEVLPHYYTTLTVSLARVKTVDQPQYTKDMAIGSYFQTLAGFPPSCLLKQLILPWGFAEAVLPQAYTDERSMTSLFPALRDLTFYDTMPCLMTPGVDWAKFTEGDSKETPKQYARYVEETYFGSEHRKPIFDAMILDTKRTFTLRDVGFLSSKTARDGLPAALSSDTVRDGLSEASLKNIAVF